MGERIVIASDHAAVEMKAMLVAFLQAGGHDVVDLGPGGVDSVDYPDYGYKIAEAIAGGRADRGIALCGSGVGISIFLLPRLRHLGPTGPLAGQKASDEARLLFDEGRMWSPPPQ